MTEVSWSAIWRLLGCIDSIIFSVYLSVSLLASGKGINVPTKVLFFLCNMDNHATVEKGGTVLGHLCACTHVPGCHIYLDKHYQAVAWCMAALGLVTTVHIFIIMLEQKQQDVGFSDETRKSE